MNQKIKASFYAIILVSSSLFLSNNCQAQGGDFLSRVEDMNTSLSYFGNNGIRPGFSKRSEINISSNTKEKENKRFWLGPSYRRSHTKAWYYTQNDAVYFHPRSHVGLIKNWGAIYRKTRTKGHEFEVGFYPLGIQVFAMGETYLVSNNGDVDKKAFSFSFHYTPGISIGYGKQLLKSKGALDAWHLRLAINGVTNYNNTIVPTANLEIGLRFRTLKLMEKVM